MSANLLTRKIRGKLGNGNGSAGRSIFIPASALSFAGFRSWVKSDAFPDHVRVTYINQGIYLDMSKEELETHNKVKVEVARVLLNLNRNEKLGVFYGDGALVTNEAAGVSNNPDGVFLSRATIQRQRVQLVSREGTQGQYLEIVGAPDWVLEVVSNSSVTKDTEDLPAAYHRAGIAEYWLIDARADAIVFHIYRWRKGSYAAAPIRDGWQRSRVFGKSFRLLRQRDDLGLWEYTLETRE